MPVTFEELIHRDADSSLRHQLDHECQAFYGKLRDICDVAGPQANAEVAETLNSVQDFCTKTSGRLHSLLMDANRDDAVRGFYLKANSASRQ